jgi:hypothetical protein
MSDMQLAPIDVAVPELYAEDRWQGPFRRLRAEAPIQYVPDSKFGPYWSVTTYKPIVHIEALLTGERCHLAGDIEGHGLRIE